jgi:hypothetical protein
MNALRGRCGRVLQSPPADIATRESFCSRSPIETGQVGWIIHDPDVGGNVILSRTSFADEFLSIAAVEPQFPHPFPIGGPLGEDGVVLDVELAVNRTQ